jgi:SsrA-binding protein
MTANSDPDRKIAAENRKARFNYEVINVFEAGIVLTGTEIKSLRGGRANIADSYAASAGSDFVLYNAYIPEYLQANRFQHETRRPRRLLLHRREINKLMGATEREGLTVVPLDIHFDDKGRAKVKLALAKGRKLHDKREADKDRDWKREQGRLLKARD